jgi:hypothetical protein
VLTVRERIDRLSTRLLPRDHLTGKPTYEDGKLASIIPSNYVLGTGRIDGRRIVVGGDDTVRVGRRRGDRQQSGLR